MRLCGSLLVLVLSCLLAAACGGDVVGAAVGDGRVRITPKGGEAALMDSGATPFSDGALVEAVDGPATVTLGVGAPMNDASKLVEPPFRGMMNVTLSPDAQLRRREGTVFDLYAGGLEVHAGPLTRRIVIFHDRVFLEIYQTSEANSDGARLRVATEGETMTVHVEKGEVLLHAPVSRPGDLHYALLLAGEHATATPGAKPVKNGK